MVIYKIPILILGMASRISQDKTNLCHERDVKGQNNVEALSSFSDEREKAAWKTPTSIPSKH